MGSYQLGAQLGARLKDSLRVKRCESFIALLEQQHMLPAQEAESSFEGTTPVRIYNNWLNTTWSYVIVFKQVAYLDLAPSLNDQEVSRICLLSRETIRDIQEVSPSWWDKLSVSDASDFLNVRYAYPGGPEVSLRLFAEVAGEPKLTQDIGGTVWLYHRLKDIVG